MANKDGLVMDSQSHYTKIGSKHMCDPRPDHSHSLHKSLSVPELHPWNNRRSQFKNPTPWHFNAAFSTTSDQVGQCYHSHLVSEPGLKNRTRFDWRSTENNLM